MAASNLILSVDSEDEPIGEFQVAEYIIFLLALDTYMRYAEETTGQEDIEDAIIQKGLRILRMADADLGALQNYIEQHLTTHTHKTILNRAVNLRVFTPQGASRRALQFRTLLSRGGPATVKGIFQTTKYVRQVRDAVSASMLDDADKALDIFAAIPMRNARMRMWIDDAAQQAGSGTSAPAPVVAGSNEATVEATNEIVLNNVQQMAASGADEAQQAQIARSTILDQVEKDARDAARRSLEVNQQPDVPPTRSEVVGVAVAATVAALSDPSRPENIPAPLRSLDDEQRAAAMTGGRVAVAAGAGAGKSTTLVSRIEYLVKDKGVNPARILACSFNTKASQELKEKIAKKVGSDIGSVMQVGTMHSIFRKFIIGDRRSNIPAMGTADEQALLKPPRLIAPSKPGEKTVNPAALSTCIRNMWIQCGPVALAKRFGFLDPGARVPEDPEELQVFIEREDLGWLEEPPSAKQANLKLNAWRGNDISLEEARGLARSRNENKAVIWYEFYLGIKGDIPNWRPPCQSKSFDRFMSTYRKGYERLGDLDDMIKIMRDILRRDPNKKRTIQDLYDHINVDEAQDLNTVQHEVFEMISEHIPEGSSDKSIFMIGDDKQAIYQFRGAKPELFQSLFTKPGWTMRLIRTNYRCQPEIVEAANRLISHDKERIEMEALPDPKKDRGRSSIVVDIPTDNAEAAIKTIGRIRKEMDTDGAEPENYAVLARTNAELNDFETACIINEVPYVRQGGKGFLEAPESKAVLGYLDLASGNDFEKMKKSLVAVLMKPDRGLFLNQEAIENAVNEALDDVARRERIDVKSVRPDDLLMTRQYARILAERLKLPYRLKIINRHGRDKGEYIFSKQVGELADNLESLGDDIRSLNDYINGEKEPSTTDLIDRILDSMKSEVTTWDPIRGKVTTTVTLREQITSDVSIHSDDDSDDEDEGDEETHPEVLEEGEASRVPDEEAPGKKPEEDESVKRKGLGAVRFLYEVAKPNSNDQLHGTDPSVARGFVAKISRYSKLSTTLRIDPVAWEREQRKIADPAGRKERPPAITLSTVHAVKGAQWPNVTVLMPNGIFPSTLKIRPNEPPPTPEEVESHLKAERNLAYVAMTRAAVNLEISCPYNGGKNGISPFVKEAGLVVGENVPKAGGTVTETVKEAAFEEDVEQDGLNPGQGYFPTPEDLDRIENPEFS